MKRMWSGVAALVLVAAGSAAAQTTQTSAANSGVTFAVFGGAALPMGNFGDAYKTGFRLGAGAGFQPAMLPIGVRLDVAYDRLTGKTVDVPGFGSFSVDDASLWSGSLNPMWSFPVDPTASIRPYILGNLGIYHFSSYGGGSSDQYGNSSSASATKFGLGGGGGIDFALAGMGAFVEAKFLSIFTSGSHANYIPVVFGVRFGGGGTSTGTGTR